MRVVPWYKSWYKAGTTFAESDWYNLGTTAWYNLRWALKKCYTSLVKPARRRLYQLKIGNIGQPPMPDGRAYVTYTALKGLYVRSMRSANHGQTVREVGQ